MQVAQDDRQFAHLRDTGFGLPAEAEAQRFTYSPAPQASAPGRWANRAPLPAPRSEVAGASDGSRLFVVGGYAQQRVNRPYLQVYDASSDAWRDGAPVPRGANHIGLTAADGVLYAVGGFVEQNRVAHADVFAYTVADDRWRALRPLGRARGGNAGTFAWEPAPEYLGPFDLVFVRSNGGDAVSVRVVVEGGR